MGGSSTMTRTKQIAKMIDGVHTEIVLCEFVDRILVTVCQNVTKFGCVIESTFSPLTGSEEYVRLGPRNDEVIFVYAKSVAALIRKKYNQRPMVLTLNLADKSPSTFHVIQTIITNL